MNPFLVVSCFVAVVAVVVSANDDDDDVSRQTFGCDRLLAIRLPRGSALAFHELQSSLERLQCSKQKYDEGGQNADTSSLTIADPMKLLISSSHNKAAAAVVTPNHDGEDHDDHEDHDALGHKIGALFVIVAVSIVGAGAPFVLKKVGALEKSMPYLNSVACGAFIGLALFHLLPEALYVTEASGIGIDVGDNWYNITFMMMFAGLSLIMILEKIIVIALSNDSHVVAVGQCHNIAHGEPHHDHNHHRLNDEESLTSAAAEPKLPSTVTAEKNNISFSAVIACLSMAVHAVAEGVVVGMLDESILVWVATLSIVGHKWAEGFALAVNCLNKGISVKSSMLYISIVILASPVGIVVGILVGAHTTPGAVGVLNGLCLGTILYTGFELLFDEFGSSKKASVEAMKFVCFLLGAGVVFALMMLHLAGGSHHH